jgi:cytochrome c biogenesis protein CcmG, thiol:disulfide interchange protein DsbE
MDRSPVTESRGHQKIRKDWQPCARQHIGLRRDQHTSACDTESGPVISRINYYNFVRRVTILTCLSVALLAGCYRGSRPPRIGSNAPDFMVQDDEHKVSLDELRGKIVVLNFWATWCPPCVEEMPSLVNLQQRLKDKGVTVVAVSVDVDENAYHRFLKDHGIKLLTVRDPDHKSSDLYGTFKFPETYVIDRDGKMRRKFIGEVDWNQPEVVEFLTKL